MTEQQKYWHLIHRKNLAKRKFSKYKGSFLYKDQKASPYYLLWDGSNIEKIRSETTPTPLPEILCFDKNYEETNQFFEKIRSGNLRRNKGKKPNLKRKKEEYLH